MLNPTRAGSQVVGISHPPYFEKVAEALRMLGCRRALVLRGVEGDPELSIASVTKVLEIRDDRLLPLSIQPKDVGLVSGSFQAMAGFPPSQAVQEAALLRRIVSNEVRGPQRDWIMLNAAMLLYAAGLAVSVSAAVPVVQELLESGAAARKLAELAAAEPVAPTLNPRVSAA
jgi:anthranilate phosphoribosyltransferase